MPTISELMRKENEALKKAQQQHKARTKKLEDSALKHLGKLLRQSDYYDYEFTDKEILAGIENMVSLKKSALANASDNGVKTMSTGAQPVTA